jgi:hypothetical protein
MPQSLCRRAQDNLAIVSRAAPLLVLTFLVTQSVSHAQTVRSGTGAGATTARDLFRTDLGGGLVAGANGLFSDGSGARREINWDGVPNAFSAPNNLPADFFNVNSPRGVVFSTSGSGFMVSDNAAGGNGVGVEFANLNASYPGTFGVFSAQKLFTPLSSTLTDVSFFIPGTTTPTTTRGFGAIFTDVDVLGSATMSFFDVGNNLIGSAFVVPNAPGSETLSFLGVSFPTAVVARVRIISGTTLLGAANDNNGDPNDLVAMDDFLYGEPVNTSSAAPEPGTLALGAMGLLPMLIAVRRRFKA